MAQMEEEANKLNQYTEQATNPVVSPTAPTFHTLDEKKEIDARSIYVGNVSLASAVYVTCKVLPGMYVGRI